MELGIAAEGSEHGEMKQVVPEMVMELARTCWKVERSVLRR